MLRLAAILLFVVFSGNSAMAESAGKTDIVVGFAQDTLSNDWRLAQVKDIEAGLAPYKNIRFVFTDGMGSTAKQIRDIEDMLASKVDILITSPRDVQAMTPIIRKAYRQGIPVILLTRKIDSDDYTTFIAPDDAEIARQAATYLAEQLHGKGKILMLQGVPSASTAIQRTNAFIEALHKYPGVTVSVIKTANYLRSDAIKAMEEVLYSGQEFDAIYAQSDSMASGARIALKKSGYDLNKIIIVGIDYISEAREAISNGEQRASFTYPTCAREAVKAVLAIVAGKNINKRVMVPSQRVTKENVSTVDPIF
jgi:ribose transport system substrate-binding protein